MMGRLVFSEVLREEMMNWLCIDDVEKGLVSVGIVEVGDFIFLSPVLFMLYTH